jgi:uncharacterized membrane protein YbhN (UPF0104 family)
MNIKKGGSGLERLKRYKNWILRISVVAVVGLTLYISLRGTDLKEVEAAMKKVSPFSFLISFFLNFLVVCAKSGRLTILLRGIEKGIRYREVLPIIFLSYFYNMVFPMRGGDILGVILLSRLKNLSKANLFGVLLGDKFIDGFVFFICSFPLIYSVFPSTHPVKALFIVLLLFILFVSIAKIFGNKKEGILKRFGEGMNTIFEKKRAFPAILMTFLSWFLQISIVYILLLNFGKITKWWAGIWFLLAVNLSILTVQSPGNIGTMEAGGTYSLMLMGYPKETSFSFTILYHLVNLLPVIIAGGIISIYMGTWKLSKENEKNR